MEVTVLVQHSHRQCLCTTQIKLHLNRLNMHPHRLNIDSHPYLLRQCLKAIDQITQVHQLHQEPPLLYLHVSTPKLHKIAMLDHKKLGRKESFISSKDFYCYGMHQNVTLKMVNVK